jgi:hypothetical protein
MEEWNSGTVEQGNNGLKTKRPGTMEYWNDGIMG